MVALARLDEPVVPAGVSVLSGRLGTATLVVLRVRQDRYVLGEYMSTDTHMRHNTCDVLQSHAATGSGRGAHTSSDCGTVHMHDRCVNG